MAGYGGLYQPPPNLRKFLWEQLEDLDTSSQWMFIGDFNCVLVDEERTSKRGPSTCFQIGCKEVV